MPVIRNAEGRRTETPNGVMTTLATPTQGGSGLAVWRVELGPGKSNPPHAFDTEQVWTVVDGSATVDLDGEKITVASGDTVVMPAEVPRRVFADSADGFAAIVAAPAGTRASSPDRADKVAPAWVI